MNAPERIFRRTGRDVVEFRGTAGSDALETLIVTPGQAGEERVSRSRPAGRISPSGQGRDIRQRDEQPAGFIERIRTNPGDGRTGWGPAPPTAPSISRGCCCSTGSIPTPENETGASARAA